MNRKKNKRDKFKKGIYILPNLFTTMNIFCGFYSIISAFNGNYIIAAQAIFIAMIFDALDGKVARATNTTSEFGVQYDSLSDLISFGAAPALLMYLWALQDMGRIGWLVAFLFLTCGALRLARFNVQTGSIDPNYFIGLPIPSGAGMCVLTVLFFDRLNIEASQYKIPLLLLMFFLAFLMVSTIKYNSFKNSKLFKRMRFDVLVFFVLLIMLIAWEPAIILFSLASIYLLSGMLTAIIHQLRNDPSKLSDEEEEHLLT